MKAVVAVVQGQDTVRLSNALRSGTIPFTTIDSTGGFLRERNSTFLMAIPDENLDAVLEVISKNCLKRPAPSTSAAS